MRTKNGTHRRRLDKVQATLHVVPADARPRHFIAQCCDVADMAAACGRAECTKAATVFFVPMAGGIKRKDYGPREGRSAGVVLAFEGASPTTDQIAKVRACGGELADAQPELGEAIGLGGQVGCPRFWVGGVGPEGVAATGPKRTETTTRKRQT